MKNKSIKKFRKVWLTAVLLSAITCSAVAQYTLTNDDVTVENGLITSCSYSFTETDIIIPETLDGQTVTGFADPDYYTNSVFYNKGITSVSLPATLTIIGEYTFYKNSLTSLDLSKCTALTTIGEGAFLYNSFTSIDLSKCTALTYIGEDAFYRNSLSSLTLPTPAYTNFEYWYDGNGNHYSGNSVVYDLKTSYSAYVIYTLTDDDVTVKNGVIIACSYSFALTDIIIPETLDNQTVIGIADRDDYDDGVFCNKGITSVNLPATLKNVGNYAFYENSLVNLDLTGCTALTTIGKEAFSTNSLISLDISGCEALTSIGESAFGYNDLTGLNISGCTALTFIGEDAFSGNELTVLDLSGCTALNSIGENAFHGNYLTTVDLSGCTALNIIGGDAFSDNSLSSIDLSGCDMLTTIGSYAFYDNSIVNLDLSDCVALTTIGYKSFAFNSIANLNLSGCSALTSIRENAFYKNTLTDLDLSKCNALVSIRYGAFASNSIASVNLSECKALTTIDDYAFSENSLTNLDISGCTALTIIGYNAFSENKFNSFTLPTHTNTGFEYWYDGNGNHYSGNSVVNDLTTSYTAFILYILTDNDVVVENGIITSCSYSFALTDIIIPETLDNQTIIGIADGNDEYGIFYDKGITSVSLPATLESIGDYAFYDNPLDKLDLSKCTGLTSIGDYAFYSNSLENIDLSGSTKLAYIGNYAFQGNFLAEIDLNKCMSLTYIGDHAFYSNSLASLDLSGCTALTYIGDYAFYKNSFSSFTLTTPVNSEYAKYGWKDGNGNEYNNGDAVNDLKTLYYVPAFYTLTDDDVVVENGIITSCSYSFALKNIIIPETLDNQTIIGIADRDDEDGIFYNKGITSVSLPATLKGIGDYAFSGNFIGSLDLGNCTVITTIGEGAFYGNSLSDINLSNCMALNSIGIVAFSNNSLSSLDFSACVMLSTIGEYAFSGNSLTTLDLSSCTLLTTIGKGAFNNNSLTSLDLNNCTLLTNIGSRAFYNNSLGSIELSKCTALIGIGGAAFSGNEFSSFILPTPANDELASLGWKDGMGNVYANGTEVSDLETDYFIPASYTLTDDDVVVENGIIISCSFSFAITDIIIPETLDNQTVTGIANGVDYEDGVFYNRGITSVSLPVTLKRIGDFAFYFNSLVNLDLSSCTVLKTISKNAFSHNSLTGVNLSSCTALTTISKEAFSSNSLTGFLDLNGCRELTSIEDRAFAYNDLTSLDLSGCTVLTNIGDGAFRSNSLGFFALPVNTEYASYGWKDGRDNTYAGGDEVSTFSTSYYVPAPYIVTFTDWDGTVLKTETTEHGNDATAPADPARDGYTFTSWDVDFSNIVSDLVVTAQYEAATSVKETVGITFMVYPNPASSVVNFYLEAGSYHSTSLEIYDLNGRKLLEKKIPTEANEIEIDVSHLKNGVYFCRLFSEKYNVTQKLIIQK